MFYVSPIVCGGSVWSLFWFALLCVLSSFAIILTRRRDLVVLLLLSFRCIVTVNALWLFLTVLWDGLQCVIVVFPDNHFCFSQIPCLFFSSLFINTVSRVLKPVQKIN